MATLPVVIVASRVGVAGPRQDHRMLVTRRNVNNVLILQALNKENVFRVDVSK